MTRWGFIGVEGFKWTPSVKITVFVLFERVKNSVTNQLDGCKSWQSQLTFQSCNLQRSVTINRNPSIGRNWCHLFC